MPKRSQNHAHCAKPLLAVNEPIVLGGLEYWFVTA